VGRTFYYPYASGTRRQSTGEIIILHLRDITQILRPISSREAEPSWFPSCSPVSALALLERGS